MSQNGYQQGFCANPRAIAKLMPSMQRAIVGRFSLRSDTDGHLLCLRQLMPQATLLVIFDLQPNLELPIATPAAIR